MCNTSFTFSWIGLVALPSTLVPSWCCWSHWYSAMADFQISPFVKLSTKNLCYFYTATATEKMSQQGYCVTCTYRPCLRTHSYCSFWFIVSITDIGNISDNLTDIILSLLRNEACQVITYLLELRWMGCIGSVMCAIKRCVSVFFV